MRPIGILRSPFKEKFGTPRQAHLAPGAAATLKVVAEFLPEHSLEGLSGFSHVWLLSQFHLNTNKKFLPKVHPPRLKGGSIGLFASRSPHHPNSLGLTLARLVKVEGDTLLLAGVDLVDGTPILDIKPYIPESDALPHASAGWTADAEFPTLKVSFSAQGLADIAEAERRLGVKDLDGLLSDILRHDLRNPRDRAQTKDGLELGFYLHDFEARFCVKGGTVTLVRLATGGAMHRKERRAPRRGTIQA
ncbi:MAG: tRNA (N6-threonylcarbamoyladenosine(37)-N6)-methyltransferase TrmO [Elusimicrobia bacterium]|nr:tRNA (N6-threonylcarbamoyladenosine(37)-N6)-methyltransferase TrmO [Elusimicrobiota bacterium]